MSDPTINEQAEAIEGSAQQPAENAPKQKKTGDLGKRVISGVVYFVVMVGALLLSDISTVIIISFLSAVCAYEFYRMMRKDGRRPATTAGVIASAAYPFAVLVGGRTLVIDLTIVIMAAFLIWFVFSPQTRITDLSHTIFGIMYCGFMFCGLVFIRLGVPGLAGGILAVGVCLSVWANDTFAYFIGSAIGKHKMAPKISPKKSWEGFFAGIVGSVIVWMLLPLFVPTLSWGWAAVAGVLCGVMGVFGDLAESRIKRGVGVKDSGNIMPGHGGLLDRSDALIFASFAAFAVLTWTGVIVL